MKKKFLFRYLAFLLLQLASCQYDIETSLSYQDKEFKLEMPENPSAQKYYKIYRFNNNHEGTTGDIVIQFAKGVGHTVKIAIYEALRDIKQNESHEFIEAKVSYPKLIHKEFTIKKGATGNVNGDLFIVIYDLKYSYHDVFRIFNEADDIELPTSGCLTIPHLYSLNKLVFYITNKEFEYIAVNIGSNVAEQPTFEIRESTITGDIIKTSNANAVGEYIQIKAGVNKYYFIIQKNQNSVAEFNKTICYEFTKNRINVITEQFTTKQFVSPMTYYYKLNISSYDVNDENAVLLDIDFTPIESFSGMYCKYAKNDEDESKLIPQYPTSDNNNKCVVQTDDLIDTSHHLYFKITNKETDTLLILIKVIGTHAAKPRFKIIIPKRVEEITKIYNNMLDITIPIYFKINPAKINAIIYTTRENRQPILAGSLSNNATESLPKFNSQLLVINIQNTDNADNIIYIKLYDGLGEMNFEVIPTINKPDSNPRPLTSFSVQLNQCIDSIYYVGYCNAASKDFIFVNRAYGYESIIYANKLETDKTIAEMLSSDTNPNAIKVTQATELSTTLDMIKISCKAPMLINLNIGQLSPIPSTITKGDSFYVSIPKNNILTNVTLKDINGIQLKLETENAEVQVYVNEAPKQKLDKTLQYFRYIPSTITRAKPDVVSFNTISGNDPILSIDIGGDASVLTETGKIQKQQFILQLDSTISYYSFTGSLKSSEPDLAFCYSSGFNDPKLVPFTKKHDCHKLTNSPFSFTFKNPYDRYIDLETQSEDDKFLILVELNTKPNQDITVTFDYDMKKAEVEIPIISETLLINKSHYTIRTQKINDINKNIMIMTFTSCPTGNKMNYKLTYDKNQIIDAGEINKRTVIETNNTFSEMDLEINSTEDTSGIMMYDFVSSEDQKSFKEIGKYEIKITASDEFITIGISPYVLDTKVEYQLYIKQGEDKQALSNYCNLLENKPNETYKITSEDANEMLEFEIPVAEPGLYQVNVQAITTDKIITFRMYNATLVSIGKSTLLWLWILLGCLGGIIVFGVSLYLGLKFGRKKKAIANSSEPIGTLEPIETLEPIKYSKVEIK